MSRREASDLTNDLALVCGCKGSASREVTVLVGSAWGWDLGLSITQLESYFYISDSGGLIETNQAYCFINSLLGDFISNGKNNYNCFSEPYPDNSKLPVKQNWKSEFPNEHNAASR